MTDPESAQAQTCERCGGPHRALADLSFLGGTAGNPDDCIRHLAASLKKAQEEIAKMNEGTQTLPEWKKTIVKRYDAAVNNLDQRLDALEKQAKDYAWVYGVPPATVSAGADELYERVAWLEGLVDQMGSDIRQLERGHPAPSPEPNEFGGYSHRADSGQLVTCSICGGQPNHQHDASEFAPERSEPSEERLCTFGGAKDGCNEFWFCQMPESNTIHHGAGPSAHPFTPAKEKPRKSGSDFSLPATETDDKWLHVHSYPEHDDFHNYGDCGGNHVDGCGFKKPATETGKKEGDASCPSAKSADRQGNSTSVVESLHVQIAANVSKSSKPPRPTPRSQG